MVRKSGQDRRYHVPFPRRPDKSRRFLKSDPRLETGNKETDRAGTGRDQVKPQGEECETENSGEEMITRIMDRPAYIQVTRVSTRKPISPFAAFMLLLLCTAVALVFFHSPSRQAKTRRHGTSRGLRRRSRS